MRPATKPVLVNGHRPTTYAPCHHLVQTALRRNGVSSKLLESASFAGDALSPTGE